MLASIHKLTTDAEGESKITLCVPSSELVEVVRMNMFFGKLLRVTVEEEKPKAAQPVGETKPVESLGL